MIDNITCDTPIESLIDKKDIEEFLSDYKETFIFYKTNLNDIVSKEISSGGLAADKALIIDNETPANIKAQDIIKSLSDTANITEFCNNVKNACSEQRRLEIERLKVKITEKINELSDMEAILYHQKNCLLSSEISDSLYAEKLNTIQGELEKYKEKYEVVSLLLY